MYKIRLLLVSVITLTGITQATAQTEKTNFATFKGLLKEKNFFLVRDIYLSGKHSLTADESGFIEAIVYNAFNQLEASNKKIEELSKKKLSDSLMQELYKLKIDNAAKLYNYADAKAASETLVTQYADLLSEEELSDAKNSLKIWTALQHEPKQRVEKNGDTRMMMTKDKAGLNNLHLTSDTASLDFIFDTGANISTITTSAAQKFNLKIIPVDIEVGTITGTKVSAQLGVCRQMKLGNVNIHNAVFLVMDDKALAFPQIDYQIHGILGFPVIEGLGEIQITKDGVFVVPQTETTSPALSNMAMDELTPLIDADGMHFTFDTGASETILYAQYYAKHQQHIDSLYSLTSISFGGAGGATKVDGYKIDTKLRISNKEVLLKQVSLLKKNVRKNKTVYGNIGQDVIRQFDKMTINFNHMFIKFD